MRAPRVVVVDELVDQCLELGDRAGLDGLFAEPFLHRLLEAFDFSAGGGVVRSRVLLLDVVVSEFVFELGAAAFAGGVSDGVDHAVVGER